MFPCGHTILVKTAFFDANYKVESGFIGAHKLTTLGDLLKDQYDIIVATEGKPACEIAKKDLPDLILRDVMMPFMDGYSVCRALKQSEETSHIPATRRSQEILPLMTLPMTCRFWRLSSTARITGFEVFFEVSLIVIVISILHNGHYCTKNSEFRI